MKFNLNHTFKECYENNKIAYKYSKRKRIHLVGAFLMLILAVGFFRTGRLLSVLFFLYALVFLFYPQTIGLIQVYFFSKKAKHLLLPTQVELDENGVTTISEVSSCENKWSSFCKIIINDKALLLYITPRFVVVLQKKLIDSYEDWNKVIELVKSKMVTKPPKSKS